MLTRIRIEVEEATAAECVEALAKYEHAIQQQEARRYRELWPISAMLDTQGGESKVNTPEEEYPTPDHAWSVGINERDFYNSQFGREVTDEVIEFDSSLPGYRGRRVVVFTRIDMRRPFDGNEIMPVSGWAVSLTGTGIDQIGNAGAV